MPAKGLTCNLKVKLDVTSARLQNIGYLLVLLSLEHRLGWKSVSWRHCLPMDVGRLPTGKKAPHRATPARGKSTCMGEMLAVEQRHTSGAIMEPNLIETRERRVPARAFWFWRMRRVVLSALLGHALET